VFNPGRGEIVTSKEKVRILAVDDNAANLLALDRILKGADLEIVKAVSGTQALNLVLEMEFACVLLDVKIPDIDGFELARIIRGDELTKFLPIIFLTGLRKDETDIFRGYELGAVDYLMKPLDPIILRSKVSVFADLFRKEVARRQAVAELQKSKEELELRVIERTAELRSQAEELSRSNKELGQFAFISSHDLKEPLRMVSIYAQLLQAEHTASLNEEGKSYLTYIVEGATRMQRLIDDLLNYSHFGRLDEDLVDVDCSKVVEEILMGFKPRLTKVGGEVSCGKLPVIQAREVQVIQLFQNLVENAIKFSGKAPPRVVIDARDLGHEHQFSVKDSGIGIKPAYHAKIFDIFQRLHSREEYPGTGIGLALCKKIVEMNRGRLWVESDEGKGATFLFTLPKTVPKREAKRA